jgi:hypothetical protein
VSWEITGADYRTPHTISAISNPFSLTSSGDTVRGWLNPEIISDVLYTVTNDEPGKILLSNLPPIAMLEQVFHFISCHGQPH